MCVRKARACCCFFLLCRRRLLSLFLLARRETRSLRFSSLRFSLLLALSFSLYAMQWWMITLRCARAERETESGRTHSLFFRIERYAHSLTRERENEWERKENNYATTNVQSRSKWEKKSSRILFYPSNFRIYIYKCIYICIYHSLSLYLKRKREKARKRMETNIHIIRKRIGEKEIIWNDRKWCWFFFIHSQLISICIHISSGKK
jgi:hypothetical protein